MDRDFLLSKQVSGEAASVFHLAWIDYFLDVFSKLFFVRISAFPYKFLFFFLFSGCNM